MGCDIRFYLEYLGLESATCSLIEHEDNSVAIVYRITLSSSQDLILKICTRYMREAYFLNALADKLPVPRVVNIVPQKSNNIGAVLMECLPGVPLTLSNLNESFAYECGAFLAHLHLNQLPNYGDPITPDSLIPDPKSYFSEKFEEGFFECKLLFSEKILIQCQEYFDQHIQYFTHLDGPCLIHRDYRPGNVMVLENKIQGIIDWASGRAGFAEQDFCSLEHGEWSTNEKIKRSFLDGYATIRPIPEYSKIMPLIRLNRALAIAGFMKKKGTWDTQHKKVFLRNKNFVEGFFS